MKRKCYPKYKPSGVEWLGDVPEHWEVKRLKCCLLLCTKKAVTDENPIALENIESRTGRFIETESEFEGDGIRFNSGDILFGKLRPYLAKVYLAEKAGESIGDIFVLRPTSEVLCKYAAAILRTDNYIEIIDGSTYGSKMPRASWEFMCNLPFPLPPLPEQQAIAAFLDRETGRIDALLGKQQKLVALLKEKRTALISRAVTKGLDASVKLKPSGVDWLGEVPEHWEVMPLKRIVSIPITDGPHETPEIFDEGIPFVSAEAIRNNKIDFERKRGFISESEHIRFSLKYHPKRDDIYMIKSGATTGNLAIVETDDEFNIWSPLAVIRVYIKKANARFILSSMNSKEFQTSVQLFWSYGTQQNIGMNVIENLQVTLPPLSEQQAIAAFLDRETTKIDSLIAKVDTTIEKLKEYRTALISAAVTGKIDLREAV